MIAAIGKDVNRTVIFGVTVGPGKFFVLLRNFEFIHCSPDAHDLTLLPGVGAAQNSKACFHVKIITFQTLPSSSNFAFQNGRCANSQGLHYGLVCALPYRTN